MAKATNVRVFLPDGQTIDFNEEQGKPLEVDVENGRIAIDTGDVIEEFHGMPFRVRRKKAVSMADAY